MKLLIHFPCQIVGVTLASTVLNLLSGYYEEVDRTNRRSGIS